MSKTYRTWNPDQTYLLPPSARDWLPAGDLVYFMLDVAQTLDLSAITRKYEQEDRGAAHTGRRGRARGHECFREIGRRAQAHW